MVVRRRRKSPLSTTSRRFRAFVIICDTTLNPLSTKYDVGKAMKKSFSAFHSDGFLSVTACCSKKSRYCCFLKVGLSSKSCLRSMRSASRLEDPGTSSLGISKGSRIHVEISKLNSSLNRSFMSASMFVRWFKISAMHRHQQGCSLHSCLEIS